MRGRGLSTPPMGARAGYRLRRLGPRDRASYREIRLRSLREDPLAFGSTYAREAAFDDATWTARLAPPRDGAPAATWAALDRRGRPVGLIVAARVEGRFHLFAMWVAPEHRGEGLGGRLLDHALRWIRRTDPSASVQLEVNPRQVAAVALYLSRGFRGTGAHQALGHHAPEIAYEMRRPAARAREAPSAPSDGASRSARAPVRPPTPPLRRARSLGVI